jgi:hypothetical protein
LAEILELRAWLFVRYAVFPIETTAAMLRRTARWDAFERDWRRRPVDYRRNLRVYEALWREARALGKLPPEDPLDGIEDDIRRTRRLHSVRTPPGEDRTDL